MVINPTYLDKKTRKSAGEVYNRQDPKNIRLDNFFQISVFKLLLNNLMKAKWKLNFHPYKYKYQVCKIPEIEDFLHGKYFAAIVKDILNIKKYSIKYEIKKFSPGCYTLLHDTEKERSGIDFTISFSYCDADNGGYTKYLTGIKELLQINPIANTISFIERKKGVMKYTKYVNHKQNEIILVVGEINCKKND